MVQQNCKQPLRFFSSSSLFSLFPKQRSPQSRTISKYTYKSNFPSKKVWLAFKRLFRISQCKKSEFTVDPIRPFRRPVSVLYSTVQFSIILCSRLMASAPPPPPPPPAWALLFPRFFSSSSSFHEKEEWAWRKKCCRCTIPAVKKKLRRKRIFIAGQEKWRKGLEFIAREAENAHRISEYRAVNYWCR